MVKWVDEKVLQRYFRDNHSEYSVFIEGEEREIQGCDFNQPFDRFPDLYCVIDGEEYPAEVEWLSSHYDHFDHEDHDRFEEQGGFLIVFRKDKQIGNFQQIEIQSEHFKKWFKRNASMLVSESIEEFEREAFKDRHYPKVWSVYISTRTQRNYEVGTEIGVWGFADSRFNRSSRYIRDIQENDVVLFLGPIVSDEDYSDTFNPRTHFDEFYTNYVEDGILTLENVSAYKVTRSYWNEVGCLDYEPIWPDEDTTNRLYPHRFMFSPTPIFKFSEMPLQNFNKPALRMMHKTMYQTMWELDYPHFMEVIRNFPGES